MRRQRKPLPLDNGGVSGSRPRRSVQSRRVDGDTTDHSASVSRPPRRRRYTRKLVRESSFNSSNGHASGLTSTPEENDSVETTLKNHIKKLIEAFGSRIIDQLERWFEELKDLVNSGTLHRSPSVRRRRDTRKHVTESSSTCSSGHASGPTSTREENDSVETMKNDIEKLIKASESRILDQVGRWFEELKDQINSGTLHRSPSVHEPTPPRRVRESSSSCSSGHARGPTSTLKENDSVETMLKNDIEKEMKASESRILDHVGQSFEELKDLINSGTWHCSPSVHEPTRHAESQAVTPIFGQTSGISSGVSTYIPGFGIPYQASPSYIADEPRHSMPEFLNPNVTIREPERCSTSEVDFEQSSSSSSMSLGSSPRNDEDSVKKKG